MKQRPEPTDLELAKVLSKLVGGRMRAPKQRPGVSWPRSPRSFVWCRPPPWDPRPTVVGARVLVPDIIELQKRLFLEGVPLGRRGRWLVELGLRKMVELEAQAEAQAKAQAELAAELAEELARLLRSWRSL